ncbi:uncharacterized protein LOC123428032 isoform X2 [Hordeum vulgare subsp. vulgare]|uniref:uncharacterized protein LOC123428032 isoform X2 n=1 Tax=Hordeum vulgare subsp. vulgare TaxID=112509 RepID=UPI001D1A3527|nr:uncharacterized protein LOC123428032 isoform X2 [Hordeum vulgare subsp. vulgare]
MQQIYFLPNTCATATWTPAAMRKSRTNLRDGVPGAANKKSDLRKVATLRHRWRNAARKLRFVLHMPWRGCKEKGHHRHQSSLREDQLTSSRLSEEEWILLCGVRIDAAAPGRTLCPNYASALEKTIRCFAKDPGMARAS